MESIDVSKKEVILEKISISIFVILITPLILWTSLLPVSEDFGYYTFIAKSISFGWVLHKDIPISTHSLMLYIVSLVYKWGWGVYVVKVFYAILFYFFALMLYLTIRYCVGVGWFAAIISAFLGVFIYLNPYHNLDIGRNYIFISNALVMAALLIMPPSKYVNGKMPVIKTILFVVFLSLAFMIRETFLFIVAPIYLYYIFFFIKNNRYRDILLIVLSLLVIIMIYIIYISYTGGLSGFISDVRGSGKAFRYGDKGVFDVGRILVNVDQVKYGYERFWGVIFFVSLFPFFRSTSANMFLWKIYYLSSIFTILVIDTTREYHIQYVFPAIIVLAVSSILSFYKEDRIDDEKVITSFSSFAVIFVFVGISSNIINTFNAYGASARMLRKITIVKGIVYAGMPYDLLPLTNSLVEKWSNYGVYSNYPLLSLSFIRPDWSYPYLQDISAHANMGRPESFEAVMSQIQSEKVDIYVDKTVESYLSQWDEFGKILSEKYVSFAFYDTRDGGGTAPYKIRFMIRKSLLPFVTSVKVGYVLNNMGGFYEINVQKGLSFIRILPIKDADIGAIEIRSEHYYSKYMGELKSDKEVWIAVNNGKAILKCPDIHKIKIDVYRVPTKKLISHL